MKTLTKAEIERELEKEELDRADEMRMKMKKDNDREEYLNSMGLESYDLWIDEQMEREYEED